MKKVVIERPRVGGHSIRPLRKKLQPCDFDEDFELKEEPFPSKISAKKDALGKGIGHYGEGKEQSDLFGPMKRFLHSKVGQPWNDVWSEICEHNKDFMGEHLKLHLDQYVERHLTRIENGDLLNERGYVVGNCHWRDEFYVDPDSGLLQVFQYKKFVYEKKVQKIFQIDGQDYYRHNDIWYRVKFEKWEVGVHRHDVFGHGNYFYSHSNTYAIVNALTKAYGVCVQCVWKQQANSKECKKLNQLVEYKKCA